MNAEVTSLEPLVFGEGLELAILETYGKVTPFTVDHGISPLILGSL